VTLNLSIPLVNITKPKITDSKDFGEPVVYADLMGLNRDSKFPQHAVLIDSLGFWLIHIFGRRGFLDFRMKGVSCVLPTT
jgi:hypothetical protein